MRTRRVFPSVAVMTAEVLLLLWRIENKIRMAYYLAHHYRCDPDPLILLCPVTASLGDM
jgi:hypothetical protein